MDSSWRSTNPFNQNAGQSFPGLSSAPYSSLPSAAPLRPRPLSSSLGPQSTSLYSTQSNAVPAIKPMVNEQTQTVWQWAVEYFITRNFMGHSLWSQSGITFIVGLIAYFLWGSSMTTHSTKLWIAYKVLVMALMSLMLYFISLMLTGTTSPTTTAGPLPTTQSLGNRQSTNFDPFAAQSRGSNNPYGGSFGQFGSMNSMKPMNGSKSMGAHSLNTMNSMNPISEQKPFSVRGRSLYFTEKQLADQDLTAALKSTKKYDLISSPTKSAAVNPGHISDSKTLDSFLKKQQRLRKPPTAATPIGKTFAMKMTPSAMFQSPTKSMNHSNQGSAMLQTPSSAMDVTMESFHHDVDEPFNADFSVIEPSPAATAWNVSTTAFGGHSAAMDMSTIAQPGTPAKGLGGGGAGGSFTYDSMYNDINLGDKEKMGEVLRERSEPQRVMQQPAMTMTETRSAAPPQSPYSRRRPQRNLVPKSSALDLMAEKSKFAAKFMERSIDLYRKLKVDGFIANWAEDIKWWMGQSVVEQRWQDILRNDKDIEQLFNLLVSKYDSNGGLKEQLTQLRSHWQRIQFVQSNRDQLGNVARCEQGLSQAIMHIVQRTQHIAECMSFVVKHFERFNENNQATEYCFERMKQLQSTRSLTLYKWNGGDAKEWQPLGLPTDSEVLMALFCRYMDDALCPAIKFSERHFIEIAASDMAKLHRIEEIKRVQDVAICCVSAHKAMQKKPKEKKMAFGERSYGDRTFGNDAFSAANDAYKKEQAAKDSLPYYFVVWNRKKFGSKVEQMMKTQHASKSAMFGGIKKPKAFLGSKSAMFGGGPLDDSFDNYLGNNKDGNEEEQQWGSRGKRRNQKDAVEAWYPEPGTNNMFHTVALFALFVQKCCDGKLGGISLRDHRCSLLEAITK